MPLGISPIPDHMVLTRLLNSVYQGTNLLSQEIEYLQSYLRAYGELVANGGGSVKRVRVILKQGESRRNPKREVAFHNLRFDLDRAF